MSNNKIVKNFPSKLRKLRAKMGWTQEELGEKIGVGKSSISEWESGNKFPRMTKVEMLCDLFNVPLEYFTEDENDRLTGMVNIPIYGSVSCGNGTVVFEDLIGYIETPRENVRGGEYFYMRAKGDSMVNAHIPDGALLLVRKQPDVEDGQIAVVAVGDEVVLKRVFRRDGLVFLQSENPDYPPIIKSEKDDVRIVGKLKRAIIDF